MGSQHFERAQSSLVGNEPKKETTVNTCPTRHGSLSPISPLGPIPDDAVAVTKYWVSIHQRASESHPHSFLCGCAHWFGESHCVISFSFRALADILRQQGPIPIAHCERETISAIDSSPKENTPVRSSSKNHYTPVRTAKQTPGK